MNERQRQAFADKLMEVGNLAVGALLLGQFLAEEFKWLWTLVGMGIWGVCYGLGYLLLRNGGDRE